MDPSGFAGEGGSVVGSNNKSTDEYLRSELILARTRIDDLEARNASITTKMDIETSEMPPCPACAPKSLDDFA
jgi:hypothetical protein